MLTTALGPKFVKNDGQSGAKSGDQTQSHEALHFLGGLLHAAGREGPLLPNVLPVTDNGDERKLGCPVEQPIVGSEWHA
jgi:hypothetical protein